MIISFKDENTGKVFAGIVSATLPPDIQNAARRKLRYLDNAAALKDLRSPPGNRLEALKRHWLGQHSIRVNGQWRICFVWTGTDAKEAEIVDYHSTAMEQLDNIHPGDILNLDFLEPLHLSTSQLAADTGLTDKCVSEIVQGQSPITLDIALRLSRYFRTTPQLWLNLQRAYDLEELQRLHEPYAEIAVYDEKIAA